MGPRTEDLAIHAPDDDDDDGDNNNNNNNNKISLENILSTYNVKFS